MPTVGNSVCEGRTSIHLRQQNGFLSSSVLSSLPHCNGARIPWKIKVKPGQYIRVTLYDFYVVKRKAASDPYSYPRCQIYAWIKEKLESGTRNVTVCGGVPRRKNVYTSATNKVELIIAPNKDPAAPRFLLQYEGENYTLTRIHAYIHAYIHTYVHTCVHTHTHARTHARMHARHAYIHTYIHTYIRTYVRTYGFLVYAEMLLYFLKT